MLQMKNNLLLLRLILLVLSFFPINVSKILLSNCFSENRSGDTNINMLSWWNYWYTAAKKWVFQKMTARESHHETPVTVVFLTWKSVVWIFVWHKRKGFIRQDYLSDKATIVGNLSLKKQEVCVGSKKTAHTWKPESRVFRMT